MVEVEVVVAEVVAMVKVWSRGGRTTHQWFGLRGRVAYKAHHLEVGRDAPRARALLGHRQHHHVVLARVRRRAALAEHEAHAHSRRERANPRAPQQPPAAGVTTHQTQQQQRLGRSWQRERQRARRREPAFRT